MELIPADLQRVSFRKGCLRGLFTDLIKCRSFFFHLVFTGSGQFTNSQSRIC